MIAIAAVIAAATAVGFWVEHRYGEERAGRAAKVVIRVMLWVMLPPVAFVNLARLDPSTGVLAGLLFGLAGLGVALALAYAIGTRVLKLPRPAVGGLMLVSGFANTGYLGLPFTAALFGTDELPNAIVYDLVLTTVGIFSMVMVWRVSRSMFPRRRCSRGSASVMAVPSRPARPTRPMRCT